MHDINDNDDYEWYYSSLRVVDGGLPSYRGASQLTPADVDDIKMARYSSRRPHEPHGVVASFAEPCAYPIRPLSVLLSDLTVLGHRASAAPHLSAV